MHTGMGMSRMQGLLTKTFVILRLFQIQKDFFFALQIADSMEVNILGIIGPILKCEWLLRDWQIALYSSVRKVHSNRLISFEWASLSFITGNNVNYVIVLQIIFVSIAIFSPILGALSDRYGRRRVNFLWGLNFCNGKF